MAAIGEGDEGKPAVEASIRVHWHHMPARSLRERGLVDVSVLATWRGLGLGIHDYIGETVYSFVDGAPKEDQIRRGEIPEITIAGRGEYHGAFRWEDLSDIVLTEQDLPKQ